MNIPYEVPRISVTDTKPQASTADLVLVPIAQDDTAAIVALLDESVGGELSSALSRGAYRAKACELLTCRVGKPWRTHWVTFIGGGARHEMGVERLRRMAVTGAIQARQQRLGRIAWADVEAGAIDAGSRIEAIADGVTTANFDGGVHKTQDDKPFYLTDVAVLSTAGEAPAAAGVGRSTAEAINGARALINESGNHLTPSVLAEKAVALASVPGITAEVLDERRIAELGMGLLLGVARGSAEPPRLVVLRYEPEGAPADRRLGLVGKGITFDTGGLSLKPADGMERMKDDMAGGASVVAAIRSIALQRLPIKVVAVVPATENMPGGRAIKPGDVLQGASGLTVEVNNTDAEGRLVLGDGLWYARELGATHLVDVATLTGACVVALGKLTSGLFATPQPWATGVLGAAARAGEKLWQLPLFDEYQESLKSEIADMLNAPGRPAGAITAAMFLKAFVGETPWAHLDIAGTAWAEESKPWQPKGATGVMIRTLVEVARAGLAD